MAKSECLIHLNRATDSDVASFPPGMAELIHQLAKAGDRAGDGALPKWQHIPLRY
jgi:hypothetical protein